MAEIADKSDPGRARSSLAKAVAYILTVAGGSWWAILGVGTIVAALTMPGRNPPADIALYAALPIIGVVASLCVLALLRGTYSLRLALAAALLLSIATAIATLMFYAMQIIMALMVLVMMLAGG